MYSSLQQNIVTVLFVFFLVVALNLHPYFIVSFPHFTAFPFLPRLTTLNEPFFQEVQPCIHFSMHRYLQKCSCFWLRNKTLSSQTHGPVLCYTAYNLR